MKKEKKKEGHEYKGDINKSRTKSGTRERRKQNNNIRT